MHIQKSVNRITARLNCKVNRLDMEADTGTNTGGIGCSSLAKPRAQHSARSHLASRRDSRSDLVHQTDRSVTPDSNRSRQGLRDGTEV